MTNHGSGAVPASQLTPVEDRQWASFSHFGGVLWFLPSLLIYLVFRDRGALTRQEAKEALNWQITYSIASMVLVLAMSILGTIFVLLGAFPVAQFLGYIPFALYVVNAVLSIMGGIRVNAGETYRYPFAIRLLR